MALSTSLELLARHREVLDRLQRLQEESAALVKSSRRITSESRAASKRYAEWRRTSGIGDTLLPSRTSIPAPLSTRDAQQANVHIPGGTQETTNQEAHLHREAVELTLRGHKGEEPAGSEKSDWRANEQKHSLGKKQRNVPRSSPRE